MPCDSTRFISGCSEANLPGVRSLGGAGAASQLSLMRHLWPHSLSCAGFMSPQHPEAASGRIDGASGSARSGVSARGFAPVTRATSVLSQMSLRTGSLRRTRASRAHPPNRSRPPASSAKPFDQRHQSRESGACAAHASPGTFAHESPPGTGLTGIPAAHSGIFRIRPHENTPEASRSSIRKYCRPTGENTVGRLHQETR